VCTLPFEYILRRPKIVFIYFVVLWLNAFPVKTGILSIYSPRELLVHWWLDYKKHCQVLSGLYCKVWNEPVPSNTMTVQTHECIACGPTGNLQGRVKFYCLTMGRILKRHSSTLMLMPDQIIKRVNQIGLREKQGQTFLFLNRSKEPYTWNNTVPKDDPEFQGLLEEEAPFPNVSAELPGVILEEEEEGGHQVVTNKPDSAFETLAAAALDNAGIDTAKQIRTARATADVVARAHATTQAKGPQLIEVNEDKIMYEITFDLQDDGIIPDYNDAVELPDAAIVDGDTATNCYPMQSCRSAVGNQPSPMPHGYNFYSLEGCERTGVLSWQ
jgi:hypothetical protein